MNVDERCNVNDGDGRCRRLVYCDECGYCDGHCPCSEDGSGLGDGDWPDPW